MESFVPGMIGLLTIVSLLAFIFWILKRIFIKPQNPYFEEFKTNKKPKLLTGLMNCETCEKEISHSAIACQVVVAQNLSRVRY